MAAQKKGAAKSPPDLNHGLLVIAQGDPEPGLRNAETVTTSPHNPIPPANAEGQGTVCEELPTSPGPSMVWSWAAALSSATSVSRVSPRLFSHLDW